MAEDEQKPAGPRVAPAARTEAALRKERQAAALRDNLRRRKARERALDEPPAKPDRSGTS